MYQLIDEAEDLLIKQERGKVEPKINPLVSPIQPTTSSRKNVNKRNYTVIEENYK